MPLHQNVIQTTYHRLPGDPVQNVSLFANAWDECIELQVQDKQMWVGSAILGMTELERYEIISTDGCKAIGALILARDPWDVHVGPCVSVFAQYVMPEYRHAKVSMRMMRECMRIAAELGSGILAYTHRVSPWRYETVYRRVR